ncbi:MAG: hypothetical protein HQK91_00830 [Nitrospirae bacterium]|nr:hypothetical protein [Nitrospirota bacterium]MBF0539982.1 hypothetical protein [Nitrospirota bacterium]
MKVFDTSNLKVGDVVLMGDNSIISKLITTFLSDIKNDRDIYSHVGMVVNENELIEAISKGISFSDIEDTIRKRKKVLIIRSNFVTSKDYAKIAECARKLLIKNIHYGWFRLGCMFVDDLLGIHYFADFLNNVKDLVCSTTVAYIYFKTKNYEFNGAKWEDADPDDIYEAFAKIHPDWHMIYCKGSITNVD